MATPINFAQFLEPFSSTIKASMFLPESVSFDDFKNLLGIYFDQPSLELKAHPLHASAHLPKNGSVFAIKVDPLSSHVFLHLPTPAKQTLNDIFFGSKEPFTDERLINGGLGYLVAKFLEDLTLQKLFATLSFYLSEATTHHESYQLLKVEMTLPGHYPLVVDLYFPESFVEAFCVMFKDQLIAHMPPVSLNVDILTGKVKLLSSAFRGLKKHDLIILDENYYNLETQKGIAKLACKNTAFAEVRLSGHSIKCLDFNPIPEEANMEHPESPLQALHDVSLEFQIEFATLKLQMKDLEKLSSGQTLEFSKENMASCFLTLQGQKVAKGELVKVGEQMAFLVQEIHHG